MKATLSFAKNYWALLVVALALIVLAAGFFAGYRIGPGFTLVESGTVALRSMPPGTQVFLDLSRRHAVDAAGATSFRLSPGAHTIIVDAEGFQPWNELFQVQSATTTTLSPILVPVEVRAKELTGGEKTAAKALIFSTKLPSKDRPLVVADGCAAVYASANKIIAEATSTPGSSCAAPEFLCEGGACAPTFVYVPAETLRSIVPYPGREDALIVASGGLIYVIELDPREPQFFAPLFKGAFAAAASWSPISVAGTDGTSAFEIPLGE
jgi:hypothetical protein